MTEVVNFPVRADLEPLVDLMHLQDLRLSLASKGVFFSHNKMAYGELISRFCFSRQWYNHLLEAGGVRVGQPAIFGVYVPSCSLDRVCNFVYDNVDKPLPGNDKAFLRDVEQRADQTQHIAIDWTLYRPQRPVIFRRENRRLYIEIREVDGGTALTAFAAEPTDVGVAKRSLTWLARKLDTRASFIDLPRLKLAQRVALFEYLLDQKAGLWCSTGESRLKIRADNPNESGPSLESIIDTHDVVLDASQGPGLQAATFHGSELRGHEFVNQLLRHGFYFSSVTFWTESTSPGKNKFRGRVELEIAFKERPKVAVVCVKRVEAADDISSPERERITREVCLTYWDLLHQHFRELESKSIGSALRAGSVT